MNTTAAAAWRTNFFLLQSLSEHQQSLLSRLDGLKKKTFMKVDSVRLTGLGSQCHSRRRQYSRAAAPVEPLRRVAAAAWAMTRDGDP